MLGNFACKKQDSFETPQDTLRTFAKAYNTGDTKLLKMCGVVDNLVKDLTYEDDHAGLKRDVPIKDIELNIISCDFQRPDLTKRFTTEKAICTCEFKSTSNKKFKLKKDILVAKKRHSFQDFSETSRWQIMSVFVDEEDD
jgi:hypothetical protein